MGRGSAMVWSRTGGVLMMKKVFLTLIVLIMILINSVVSAEEIDSDILVNDMYNNPKNYVYIGHISNAGDSIFVMKSSVDVQEYKPPKYIIKVRCAQFWARGLVPLKFRPKDTANLSVGFRFMYDYNLKKIYVEERDKNNKINWRQLDEKKANGGLLSMKSMEFTAAELAFYWAYNMSFFDEPVSDIAKQYIKKGNGTFESLR